MKATDLNQFQESNIINDFYGWSWWLYVTTFCYARGFIILKKSRHNYYAQANRENIDQLLKDGYAIHPTSINFNNEVIKEQ